MVRAKSLENKPTGHALQPKPNSRSWSSEVSSGRNVPGAQTSHSEDSPSSATKPGWQGDVTVKFAHSMVWLPELPPVEYVRNVIDSYELPDGTVTQLKNKYKLE